MDAENLAFFYPPPIDGGKFHLGLSIFPRFPLAHPSIRPLNEPTPTSRICGGSLPASETFLAVERLDRARLRFSFASFVAVSLPFYSPSSPLSSVSLSLSLSLSLDAK